MPDPLHPAVVHFPIALAALLPLFALLAALAIRLGMLERRGWAFVVLLNGLLVGTALFAEETGEDQEERVEEIVDERYIHEHHEAAERLIYAAAGSLVATVPGLLAGAVGALARGLSVAAAFALLVLALDAGKSGGALVYEHGAAAAYAKPGPPADGTSLERREHHH